VITGDADVLRKLHINVYMDRDEGSHSWRTIFLNGKTYSVNNQNVDRFVVYVNFNNELFIDYSYDNIAKMVGDASVAPNTLLFCKINSNIFLSDSIKKCSEMNGGEPGLRKLIPLGDAIGRDLSEAKKYQNIKSEVDEKSYVLDQKKSFFEVVTSGN
jgi:hypothetical protein